MARETKQSKADRAIASPYTRAHGYRMRVATVKSYQTVTLYKMALSRKKVVRQGKGDSEEQGGGGGYVGKGCCQKAWLPYFMWLR